MLNKKTMYTLLLFLFPVFTYAVNTTVSAEKPAPVNWSPFQGKKTWQDAKDHCQSLNMRLPTITELSLAMEAGTTKSWRKFGTRFWAVNKKLGSDNSTYEVISILELKWVKVDDGKWELDIFENHKAESLIGVVCANVTEESTQLEIIRELVENKASESEIHRSRFSEDQGSLTWDDANKRCKSLKMRLPTLDELKKAYRLNITESWQKDGDYYWSSTPYDAERYYLLIVDSGNTDYNYRNSNGNVRCRR